MGDNTLLGVRCLQRHVPLTEWLQHILKYTYVEVTVLTHSLLGEQ